MRTNLKKHLVLRWLAEAKRLLVALIVIAPIGLSHAEGKTPVIIGLDAEFGHQTSTSADAIKRGMEIAIDEINQAGGVLGGRPLKLEIRDNRSVPARGVANVKELAGLSNVVAIFGGKFSPVVQESVPTIHELKIPFLDPWAAADNIVDNGYSPNFVFRLSLRDSVALQTILEYANKRNLNRVALMLPNTGWGRSSKAAAAKYIANNPRISIVKEVWYNWGDSEFAQKYDEVVHAHADVLVLVANEKEGSAIVKMVATLPKAKRLPILSHWGVTGGEFVKLTGGALLQVDFAVVQTYSFIGSNDNVAKRVLRAMKEKYGVNEARQIESPVGVAHAYDLVHILAKAIDIAGSDDRQQIRNALEKIPAYHGLVGTLQPPFTPARHEALPDDKPFMARFAADGAIERIAGQ